MDIINFGNELKKNVENSLGEGYTISLHEVIKNNGILHNAMTIRQEGSNVAPSIYFDELFDMYKEGEPFCRITAEILKLYNQCKVDGNMDFGFFRDFDEACPLLSFKLAYAKPNMERLKDVPVKAFEDLVMIPVCIIDIRENEHGSITITEDHLKMWEVSKEELWENIMDNTTVVLLVSVKKISDYVGFEYEDMENILESIFVVSTESGYQGACAALYPGVLRRISEKLEDDLFVIPSSVHEMIVMPMRGCSIPPEFIRQMINEVNSSVVKDEEVLSPSLYYYSRYKEELKIWDLDLKFA